MKKLNTKESFAGTRISIQDEAGNELTNIDYLSFGANKMDAKLFAGQIVNAWNKTYGEGVSPGSIKTLKEMIDNSIDILSRISTKKGAIPLSIYKEIDSILQETNPEI